MDITKLKTLLRIDETDKTNDEILEFCLDSADEYIINYCRIDEVPSGLSNLRIRMASDFYNNKYNSDVQDTVGISTIKEGDTQIQYNGLTAQYETNIFDSYKRQLNRYRRLFYE